MTEVGIETITTIAALRDRLDAERGKARTIGFVPTMGYLHQGHRSLMRAAADATDFVVTSIFVNPLQFGADEDLDDYPRDLQRDTELSSAAGVHLLFIPTVQEMYPFGPVLTQVAVPDLANRWEGATRPEHFRGVATVVSKLFNIVGPCAAFFGEKDYQQLAIIKRMVGDLSIPVTVVGCPIIREADGLAMSSRNTYLTPAERAAAPALREALVAGLELLEAGVTDPARVTGAMRARVDAEPLADLDYVAAVDPATLVTPEVLGSRVRLLIAAQLGRPRLIDNTGYAGDSQIVAEVADGS